MIDYTEIRRATESHIAENFDTVPVKYENVDVPSHASEYIALRDQASFSDSLEMGATAANHLSGVMMVDIFTLRGLGTQKSRELATELDVLLSNQQIEFISFQGAALHTVGDVDGTEYFQQVLQIEYSLIYGQEPDSCEI